MILLFPAWASAKSVSDVFGREVILPDDVNRVVVLSRDLLEMVRVLGAMNKVVGVSDTALRDPEFWPELANVQVVGRWNDPDYEYIAKLNPELVISYGRYPGPEADDKLNSLGIKILRLDINLISTFERDLRNLAKALNTEQKAEEYLAWRKEKLAIIGACLKSRTESPKIYLEGYQPLQTWGPGTGGNEATDLARLTNIAANLPSSYGEISAEWIVRNAPYAIVKVSPHKLRYQAEDASALEAEARTIAQRPGFNVLEAVRAERIFVLSSELHAGPRAPVGQAYLVKWLYPGCCPEVDPKVWNCEYLERFQGMPCKGYFAWPESFPEAR